MGNCLKDNTKHDDITAARTTGDPKPSLEAGPKQPGPSAKRDPDEVVINFTSKPADKGPVKDGKTEDKPAKTVGFHPLTEGGGLAQTSQKKIGSSKEIKVENAKNSLKDIVKMK